jgi:hypothetical protein
MQQHAELTQRTEHLDAEHENDEKARQADGTALHAVHTERQRRHRADGDARVRDAAREHVRAEHPHRALEQRPAFLLQQAAARRALPERLEGRQALQRVEELRAVRGVRAVTREARRALATVPDDRRQQREQRGGERDERHRQIDEGDEGEDQHGRQRGHRELRQVLTEVHLELLDPLDHREHDVARPRAAEVRGTEHGDMRVERAAQRRLHERGGVMREHRAPVLERAARDRHRGHERDRQRERRNARPRQHLREQPAEQREPRDAGGDGDQADHDCRRDAPAHAGREAPELSAQVHASRPFTAVRTVGAVGQSRRPQHWPGSSNTAESPARRAPSTSIE